MKNNFSLFEKIYATTGIVNLILFITGIFAVYIFGDDIALFLILICPIAVQFVITGFLVLLFEVILNKIWGCDIHIFPSVFKE